MKWSIISTDTVAIKDKPKCTIYCRHDVRTTLFAICHAVVGLPIRVRQARSARTRYRTGVPTCNRRSTAMHAVLQIPHTSPMDPTLNTKYMILHCFLDTFTWRSLTEHGRLSTWRFDATRVAPASCLGGVCSRSDDQTFCEPECWR